MHDARAVCSFEMFKLNASRVCAGQCGLGLRDRVPNVSSAGFSVHGPE